VSLLFVISLAGFYSLGQAGAEGTGSHIEP